MLNLIKKELAILNQSAFLSLEEGLEETLTLHRLGMFSKLGISFKTTNCIENIMRQVGIYTDRGITGRTVISGNDGSGQLYKKSSLS